MPYRHMYYFKCLDCQQHLTASCELNANLSAIECPGCKRIYGGSEIEEFEIEGKATMTVYNDGSPNESLQPKHKRIKRPMSKQQLERYKSLERAEQNRNRRQDHEATDD